MKITLIETYYDPMADWQMRSIAKEILTCGFDTSFDFSNSTFLFVFVNEALKLDFFNINEVEVRFLDGTISKYDINGYLDKYPDKSNLIDIVKEMEESANLIWKNAENRRD